ncbi:MAG: hypothetical protein RXQ68_02665 [Candidatus Nanopusillus sp.]
MTADKYGLDYIMREFYKEFKGYLKKAGIEIKGVRLRVLESPDLLSKLSYMINTYDINKLKQELNTIDKNLLEQISNYDNIYIINKENLREFYIGEIYLFKQIYNTDDIKELNKKILKYVIYPIENEKIYGMSIPEIKEIYIIKDQLEKGIDEILNELGPVNINGPSIIRLGWPLFSIVSAPLYTKRKNIKKDVAKVFAANKIIHEIDHFIVDREDLADWELSVSALQYITYIDMYNLLKYSETYEIIKENIIECKKYIENLITDPYGLGECYANIIIDKNKKTSYLNIKDVIEEVKNLSKLDAITKIIIY